MSPRRVPLRIAQFWLPLPVSVQVEKLDFSNSSKPWNLPDGPISLTLNVPFSAPPSANLSVPAPATTLPSSTPFDQSTKVSLPPPNWLAVPLVPTTVPPTVTEKSPAPERIPTLPVTLAASLTKTPPLPLVAIPTPFRLSTTPPCRPTELG